ncbi:PREDICTED: uncharacterized protein At4g04775-like [Nicotiana attenuata]|uniref:uncharacterized protein At4g04775-like n=1 Tax=Nicotiana attenuata TaxID=49451 RepID=UPI000905B3A3|nr:PREDICTED: uncharacterized protein At4g04775-like [Nicotiana attenuata]
MSENNCSSKRICRCGEVANHFTSKTLLNPGRRFYKCPKPESEGCGFWEWHDEKYPDAALIAINNVRLEAANHEIKMLNVSLEALKVEKDGLTEKIELIDSMKKFEVKKNMELEAKVVKLKMIITILCSLIVVFAFSSIMK